VEDDSLPVVKQFLHLLQNDVMVAGNDRFDAYGPSLRSGDLVLQETHISVAPGDYQLEIGLYDPSTERRWTRQGSGEDRLFLDPISIGASSGG
jgi:hypothetical protein